MCLWKTKIAIEECYFIVDVVTRNDDFPKLCELTRGSMFPIRFPEARSLLQEQSTPVGTLVFDRSSSVSQACHGHFGSRWQLGLLAKSTRLRIGHVYVRVYCMCHGFNARTPVPCTWNPPASLECQAAQLVLFETECAIKRRVQVFGHNNCYSLSWSLVI